MKHIPLSLIILSVSAAASAREMPTFDPQRLSEQVKTLSSDAFEGRGPATVGETKTVAYVIEQMKAAGIQPGGDLADGKRAWTQAVPLLRAEITGQPVLSLDINGKKQTLTQGDEIARE